MALLTKPSEVSLMLVAGIQAGSATIGMDPDNVYYGDRNAYPQYPAASVEVVDSPRKVRFVQRTEYFFAGIIMVYFGRYEDADTTRRRSDEFGEKVVDVLNADINWKDGSGDARLIQGWCTRLEPGYANRGQKVFASRITWEAKSMGPLVGP